MGTRDILEAFHMIVIYQLVTPIRRDLQTYPYVGMKE